MRKFLFLFLLVNISCFGNELKSNPIIQFGKNDSIKTLNRISLDTTLVKNIRYLTKDDNYFSSNLASIIALIALFVSNIVLLKKIQIESKEAIRRELVISSIKFDNSRLEDFYDPIYTTLSTNEGIFNSFGPRSYPEDEDLKAEASLLWNKMARKIILPNNRFISDIITRKSHLIIDEDKLENYLDFLKHAMSYERFIKSPNSNRIKYDVEFKNKVEENRLIVINRIKQTKTKY